MAETVEGNGFEVEGVEPVEEFGEDFVSFGFDSHAFDVEGDEAGLVGGDALGVLNGIGEHDRRFPRERWAWWMAVPTPRVNAGATAEQKARKYADPGTQATLRRIGLPPRLHAGLVCPAWAESS